MELFHRTEKTGDEGASSCRFPPRFDHDFFHVFFCLTGWRNSPPFRVFRIRGLVFFGEKVYYSFSHQSMVQWKMAKCLKGNYNWRPGDSKWPFHPLVGGHLTLERVTFSASQKGHQQNCQETNPLLLVAMIMGGNVLQFFTQMQSWLKSSSIIFAKHLRWILIVDPNVTSDPPNGVLCLKKLTIHIYPEPNWPLFLQVFSPPKQGRTSNQNSRVI